MLDRVDSCLMERVPPPSRELFGSLEVGMGACTDTKETGETGGKNRVLKTQHPTQPKINQSINKNYIKKKNVQWE